MKINPNELIRVNETIETPARYLEIDKCEFTTEQFNRLKRTANYQIHQKGLQAEVYCCISQNTNNSPYEYEKTKGRRKKVFAINAELEKHIHFYVMGKDKVKLCEKLKQNEIRYNKKNNRYCKINHYGSNCIPI